MRRGHILFLIAIFFSSPYSYATNRVSTGSGNWATAGTWSPSGIPAAGDNITIAAGDTVTMDGNPGARNDLTINGTASWGGARTTNISGNLTMNNGSSIAGNVTGTLNVTGTFTIPAGATVTIGKITTNITGATSVSGSVTFNSASGTKNFGALTINR